MCDFDVCNHCAMRSNKAGGEGLIRGDKGIKEQKEVTSYGYFCRALAFTMKHTHLVCISILCLLITCGTNLVLPHFTGRILDNVAEHKHVNFAANVKFYVICAVSTGFFGSVSTLAITIIGRKIAADIRQRLFSNMMVQDITFFDGMMTGQLTSRLTNDTNGMVSPMRTLMNTILVNIIKFFGGLVMCLYTSWRLSILAFTSIGPIIFLISLYAQFSRDLNRQIWSALGDANVSKNT
jgi:ATP-binding cassette, subfamily B, bacterial